MKWFVVFAIAGCGASEKPQQPMTMPTATDDASCPMVEPGTSVTEEDTTNGGALVFVTSPASMEGVRKRTATLAAMNNQHSGPTMAMGMMIGTQSTAVVEDVPTGSRVVFTPASPDDAPALQNELRMHARHLQPGSCKM